jgi:hypothetical protein
MARGELRIYLGAAPGVGKTYAMLSEAHRRVERGTDCVVAFVERHHRPRTEVMLHGLEQVPRKELEYRGTAFTEMDVDAVPARRPRVASRTPGRPDRAGRHVAPRAAAPHGARQRLQARQGRRGSVQVIGDDVPRPRSIRCPAAPIFRRPSPSSRLRPGRRPARCRPRIREGGFPGRAMKHSLTRCEALARP